MCRSVARGDYKRLQDPVQRSTRPMVADARRHMDLDLIHACFAVNLRRDAQLIGVCAVCADELLYLFF